MSYKKYGQTAVAVYIISKYLNEFISDYIKQFHGSSMNVDYSDGDYMLLHSIEVPEVVRRKGLGSALLTSVKCRAERLNLPIILTTEPAEDTHLKDFYLNNGFSCIVECLYIYKP